MSFAMIPADVINGGLEPVSRAAYEYLVWKARGSRHVRFTLNELGRNIKRGKDAARRAVRDLTAAGYILQLPTPTGARYVEYRLTHSVHAKGQLSKASMTTSADATPPLAVMPSVKASTNSAGATHTYTRSTNGSRNVRATKSKDQESLEPSDRLIEALRPFTEHDYLKAQDEARRMLRTLGEEKEEQIIDGLRHPMTRQSTNPIGFVINAIRKYDCVLDYHPKVAL